MSLSWQRKWFPLLIPVGLVLAWLALALLPHLAGGSPLQNYANPQILMQADKLKALIDRHDPNLRIIDFRHKAKYYLGHIPGAIQVWRPETEDRSQPFPGQPAPAHQLEKLLSRKGVGSHDTIVIYSDQCDHTRLWWLLAHYGLPISRMRLLDGGYEAWKAKGYPTQLTSPHFKAATFRFPAGSRKDFLWAGLEDVTQALAAPGKAVLDVRPLRLYLGEQTKEGAARPGHIPGAVGIPWQENLEASGPLKGHWKSAAELKKLYASRGITPDEDIYIYSHSNRSASFALVSLDLAGYPLERLHIYSGSWVEWSRSQQPVAMGRVEARRGAGKK
jgi:thiosulfate/3-mercaptopyruvate sulfurtransferase